MNLNLSHLGRFAAVAAVVCWSTGNVIVARLELSGIEIAFWRQSLGVVVYGVVFFAIGKRVTWEQIKIAFPVAVLFCSEIVVFFSALSITTVANATIIGALQTIVLIFVAGGKFGEIITKRLIGISIFATGGVAVVVLGSSNDISWSPLGDLLALLAMILFSGYFVAVKSVRSRIDTFTLQTLAMLIGSIGLLPFLIIFRDSTSGFPALTGNEFLWILVLLAIPGSGHFLMNWAHLHVSLSLTGLLMLAIPVFSAGGAWIFLDQSVSLLQILGGAIVIAALIVVTRDDVSSQSKEKETTVDS
jgi:drug/metabolite transporter (DMT)-like permease